MARAKPLGGAGCSEWSSGSTPNGATAAATLAWNPSSSAAPSISTPCRNLCSYICCGASGASYGNCAANSAIASACVTRRSPAAMTSGWGWVESASAALPSAVPRSSLTYSSSSWTPSSFRRAPHPSLSISNAVFLVVGSLKNERLPVN